MIPAAKNQLMQNIVTGTPRKTSSKPIIEGIYHGVETKKKPMVGSDIKNVKSSATTHAVGQFGGFSAIEGVGRK